MGGVTYKEVMNMKAVKWFSKAMTLGFVFFMALLLVNPENSLEFVAMIPFGAFAAYKLGNVYVKLITQHLNDRIIGHTFSAFPF